MKILNDYKNCAELKKENVPFRLFLCNNSNKKQKEIELRFLGYRMSCHVGSSEINEKAIAEMLIAIGNLIKDMVKQDLPEDSYRETQSGKIP